MHPRVIRSREYVPFYLLCIIIISFIKTAILNDYPVMRYLLWLAPPLYRILEYFGESAPPGIIYLFGCCLDLVIYSVILLLIQLLLLYKRKY